MQKNDRLLLATVGVVMLYSGIKNYNPYFVGQGILQYTARVLIPGASTTLAGPCECCSKKGG